MDKGQLIVSRLKILALAGSARAQSFNVKLLAIAAEMAREMGCEVDVADLRDYPMPLYDGDSEREHGLPEEAKALKARVRGCDALLLACPEYNASITPLLKNTIDWVSRPEQGVPNPFKMRTTALISASVGALGGLRGLPTVRAALTQLGALVVPTQFAVPQAMTAFDEGGRLVNEAQLPLLKETLTELITVADALRVAGARQSSG